ncbi:MAG: DNA polymerase III subunit alpha [Chthonomonadales bacterium]|nr:DNA polymerase III subunit alpha [Chthonomonadales bacterium]
MFVHLHVHSPYSFLDGASDIEALVRRAAGLGMPALALTDHGSVCAAVKFTALCRGYGIKPILGAELTMEDETHLVLLARDRGGYANLCRLLTRAHEHGGRLTPSLPWGALEGHAEGLFCLSGCRRGLVPLLVRAHQREAAREAAERLCGWFGRDRFFVELQQDLTPYADMISRELASLARAVGVGVVATNNVHYAERSGFPAHDILRCIATKTTREQAHPGRPFNDEQYLKSEAEMLGPFLWCPEAIAAAGRIAEQCEDPLPRDEDLTPRYPVPEIHAGAAGYLRHLAYKGAAARYRKVSPPVRARLEHELQVIGGMGYADYFLMVWEIVRWARRQGIRATGRGSAADSCVAYCLCLTDVDVIARNLPFARFLAPGKTPDIDMDFPAERRDDVFRYIVEKYGEERVGMVCMYSTFWARSALRDVGKALGIPEEALKPVAGRIHHFVRADHILEAFDRYAELRPHRDLIDRFRLLFDLCGRIAGFPRHIGTHSSGVVISREPLATIAPLQPSARGITRIWTLDKDDAEAIGAIKFDVLSLRALSAVGDAERDIARRDPSFHYDRIPMEDEETYRMFRAGAAIGAFQFESAAQMSLAATLHPRHFEDLVAAVALIRPGPIRGNVVARFVACRNGWMRADFAHPCLVPVLAKTYGCIVFQEQVNDVVAAMTGCSDADADRFRKSLTRHGKMGTMDRVREEFVRKSRARHSDMDPEAVHRLFDQIEGWGGYGFTEGHAASFALTGYKTAYLSVHHPAEHFAGMMNHQPMGFFSNNTLAAEARRRGVRIQPVDINRSEDKCFAEEPDAIRLGLRLVAEMREEDILAIVEARRQEPFVSLLDFCARVPMHRDRLENLILCGAFDDLHDHRRGLLWALDETLALAASYRTGMAEGDGEPALALGSPRFMQTPIARDLDDFGPWENYLWSWRITGVCAGSHVFAYLRDTLACWNIQTAYEANRQRHGTRVTVAGLNIRPHRPPTRSGEPVIFTLIEDETEMLQATCAGAAIETCTPVFLTAPAVVVRGVIARRGSGATLQVEKARPLRMRELARRTDLLAEYVARHEAAHVAEEPALPVHVRFGVAAGRRR